MTAQLCIFNHTPPVAPRKGLIGELAFSHSWAQAMNRIDDFGGQPLDVVLTDLGRPVTQRMATVAAGFITWLGTGIGCAYLTDAKRLCKTLGREDAYFAAWAVENQRRAGRNNGFTILEWILVDGTPQRRLPSSDDAIAGAVARWLGSPEGQGFLVGCEQLIATHQSLKRLDQSFGLSGDDSAHGTIERLLEAA